MFGYLTKAVDFPSRSPPSTTFLAPRSISTVPRPAGIVRKRLVLKVEGHSVKGPPGENSRELTVVDRDFAPASGPAPKDGLNGEPRQRRQQQQKNSFHQKNYFRILLRAAMGAISESPLLQPPARAGQLRSLDHLRKPFHHVVRLAPSDEDRGEKPRAKTPPADPRVNCPFETRRKSSPVSSEHRQPPPRPSPPSKAEMPPEWRVPRICSKSCRCVSGKKCRRP